MLLEIDEVCGKLGIDYFIIGGTLLGAVRHKGFIPWDDDIDIGMMRSDYEIFVQKAQELLPAGSFLQTRFTDTELPCCFAKVRKDDTTFIETSMKDLHIHHGIYVDVFPFDYYPQNRVLAGINKIRLTLITHKVSEAFYSKEKPEYSLQGKIAHILSDLYKMGFKTDMTEEEYLRDAYYRTSPDVSEDVLAELAVGMMHDVRRPGQTGGEVTALHVELRGVVLMVKDLVVIVEVLAATIFLAGEIEPVAETVEDFVGFHGQQSVRLHFVVIGGIIGIVGDESLLVLAGNETLSEGGV